jgi:hypothetical protein
MHALHTRRPPSATPASKADPWQWPQAPAAAAAWAAPVPAAPAVAFTLGSRQQRSSGGCGGTPAKSPRKAASATAGRQRQQQQQQQQPAASAPVDAAAAAAAAAATAAVREAQVWIDRAQVSWNARRFEQAESEFTQGIYAVAAFAGGGSSGSSGGSDGGSGSDAAANMLCQLYNNRCAGGHMTRRHTHALLGPPLLRHSLTPAFRATRQGCRAPGAAPAHRCPGGRAGIHSVSGVRPGLVVLAAVTRSAPSPHTQPHSSFAPPCVMPVNN